VTLDTGNPDLDVPSFYEGKTISRLGPGEFFGEGAVFPKMRRNWLVEAHGATKLYYISRMDLVARILFYATLKVLHHNQVSALLSPICQLEE
jgi:CRP-like cAMP-binding protein